MSRDIEAVRKDMQAVIPHFRYAIKQAREQAAPEDTIRLGIMIRKPDGSGQMTATFNAGEFFEDLACLLGLPTENTKEEEQEAKAIELLDRLGLRSKSGTAE